MFQSPPAPAPTTEPVTPDTGILTGTNGRIWTARWAPPCGAPRAIVLLHHGYAEYLGRYEHVVTALTGTGYVVHGLDHHGHGRSAGRRAATRRFDDFVDDAEALLDRARIRDPGLPVFLYGHSMGGLIATRLALRRQDDLAGLVVTGPAFRVGDDPLPVVRRLGGLLARLAPDLPMLAPVSPDVLSRDPEVGRRFAADPLCYQGRIRPGLAYAMFLAGEDTRARTADLTLPLLIFHGADDQLTSPAGSEEVHARATSPDKTFRPWPGLRHELHNEPEQAEVIAAILAWLDAHTPPPEQVAS